MRLCLATLAVMIASSFPGVHALERQPETGLPRLESRQALRALCEYTASKIEAPSVTENEYNFSIDLPGTGWKTICHQSVMKPILETIELRCLEVWEEKGSLRVLEKLDASLSKGMCRISFKVIAEPEWDQAFPKFEDDCILAPKPEPCAINSRHLPWPSECSLVTVGLCLQFPGYVCNSAEQ